MITRSFNTILRRSVLLNALLVSVTSSLSLFSSSPHHHRCAAAAVATNTLPECIYNDDCGSLDTWQDQADFVLGFAMAETVWVMFIAAVTLLFCLLGWIFLASMCCCSGVCCRRGCRFHTMTHLPTSAKPNLSSFRHILVQCNKEEQDYQITTRFPELGMDGYLRKAETQHKVVYGDVPHGSKWLAWTLQHRLIVKILFVATVILGVIAMICYLVLWNSRFITEIQGAVAEKIIDWAKSLVDSVREKLIVDGTTDPPTYFDPITQADFDEFYKNEADFYEERGKIWNDEAKPIVELVSGLSVLFSFLPALVMLGMFLVAQCFPHFHVRYPRLYPIFTYITALVSYLLTFVYAILCIVLFVLGFSWTFVCGEQSLYLDNPKAEGGLNYLTGECNSAFPTEINESINDAEAKLADGMCVAFTEVCEATSSGTTPPYVCPGSADSAGTTLSTCTKYSHAAAYYNSLQMKSNAATQCAQIDTSKEGTTANISELTTVPADLQQQLDALGDGANTVTVPVTVPGTAFTCGVDQCAKQCATVSTGMVDGETIARAQLAVGVFKQGTQINDVIEEARSLTNCESLITNVIGLYTTCGHTTFLFYYLGVIMWLFNVLFMGLVVFLWILQSATPLPPPRPVLFNHTVVNTIPDDLMLASHQETLGLEMDDDGTGDDHRYMMNSSTPGFFGTMQREDFEDLVVNPPEAVEIIPDRAAAARQRMEESL